MAINTDIAHRLLDIFSVILITGVAYAVLRMTATRFDGGEQIAVLTLFLGAVADKLGFRLLHNKVK